MSAPKPSGIGVDASGGPVIDPTANVLALVEAQRMRLDDLRDAGERYSDLQHKHQQGMAAIRAQHESIVGALREGYQEKIARAESGRLDSIRQVDREEVAKTAVAANTAITTLAKQTTDLATTLQKQVADTATAAEARNSATYTDVNKRLSALELSSSEGKGKQTVVDPQIDKVSTLVEALARTQASQAGKSEGIGSTWAAILAVAGVAVAVVALIFAENKSATVAQTPPQVIYLPLPSSGQTPTPTPTTTTAR